ncbi:hypothetical protein T492DRAFT_842127 [Pavlovales sp. CCMP2436]|nr:hypothetical protein T492DRAFT_842127 [Pavlovales sp. CCMP2436]
MALVGERMADLALTRVLPDLRVRMAVDGVDSWLISVRAGVGSVELESAGPSLSGPAECVCASTLDALERIASGRLKPALAAVTGQVRLSGERRVLAHLKDVLGGAARAALAAERADAEARVLLRVGVMGFAIVDSGTKRYAAYEVRALPMTA